MNINLNIATSTKNLKLYLPGHLAAQQIDSSSCSSYKQSYASK